MHSTIIWLSWKGVGETPAIVNDQGEVLRLPLLWLVKLAKEEASSSKLRDSANGLCRFNDYWQQYHPQFKVDHDLGPVSEEYDQDALLRVSADGQNQPLGVESKPASLRKIISRRSHKAGTLADESTQIEPATVHFNSA
ncbi:MAG: hypothetical protein ABSA83_20140 [Verrucomicrobiota bacterium]|jgi:hypothetical protein